LLVNVKVSINRTSEGDDDDDDIIFLKKKIHIYSFGQIPKVGYYNFCCNEDIEILCEHILILFSLTFLRRFIFMCLTRKYY
jgi:hypothetical protein